jgi:hypothetical protein
MRTIHIYRAARTYFVDGISWGEDEEGVRFYLDVTGVPADQITKALAQVAQEGTSIIHQDKRQDSTRPRELLSPAYPD